jgi:multidrug efflux pump subunit AcrA (membrane-fusion protein)
MQQKRKARRVGLFVALGIVVVAAVGAVLVVPRLMASSEGQTTDTVIAYATAAIGDVSTTVAGSGTLEEASADVEVPVGVTITDVYVRAGDTVVEGDVLAAVDADSVLDALDLVDEETDNLTEALSALGESTTLERMIVAYDELSNKLNTMYSSGYIKASSSGTIGSVNIKKGDTITASSGSGSGSTDNASSSSANSSGTSGASNSSGIMPASYTTSRITTADDDSSQADYIQADYTQASYTQANYDSLENEPVDGQTEYQLSALPSVKATVAQAKAACVASASATSEEATKAYLIKLCEARAWDTADPATSRAVSVNYGSFVLAKGVYPVVFSVSDDPEVTRTSYVVLDDGAAPNNGGDSSGGNGSDSGGGADSAGTGNTNPSGSTGGSGSGSGSGSGASSGGSSTAQGDASEETIMDSAEVLAFQILLDDEVEVQLQLDEMDVAAVKVNQQATIELSALEGQTFEGTVSSVSTSDGSYYAVVTIPKAEGMYAGFSATATIVKEQASGAITIPLEAVQQRGSELFVYTSATDDGELGGETLIETGLSNENTVEVTSGLSEGMTVYYQQQLTNAAASTDANSFGGGQGQGGMGGGFGNMGGGAMSGGGPTQMPDFGSGGGGGASGSSRSGEGPGGTGGTGGPSGASGGQAPSQQ